MAANLRTIVKLTLDRVEGWRRKGDGVVIDIVKETLEHLMACIQASVFGLEDAFHTLSYESDGKIEQVSIGVCVKKMSAKGLLRNLKIFRIGFSIFDRMYIG